MFSVYPFLRLTALPRARFRAFNWEKVSHAIFIMEFLWKTNQRKTRNVYKGEYQESSTMTPRIHTLNLFNLRLCATRVSFIFIVMCGIKSIWDSLFGWLQSKGKERMKKKMFILDTNNHCIKCIWNASHRKMIESERSETESTLNNGDALTMFHMNFANKKKMLLLLRLHSPYI